MLRVNLVNVAPIYKSCKETIQISREFSFRSPFSIIGFIQFNGCEYIHVQMKL